MTKGEKTKRWNDLFKVTNLQVYKLLNGKGHDAILYCQSKEVICEKGAYPQYHPNKVNEEIQNDVPEPKHLPPHLLPDLDESPYGNLYQTSDEEEKQSDVPEPIHLPPHPLPDLDESPFGNLLADDQILDKEETQNDIDQIAIHIKDRELDERDNDKDRMGFLPSEYALPGTDKDLAVESKSQRLSPLREKNKASFDPSDQKLEGKPNTLITSPSQESNDTIVLIRNADVGKSPILNDLTGEVQIKNVIEMQRDQLLEKIKEGFNPKIQFLENSIKELQAKTAQQQEKQEKTGTQAEIFESFQKMVLEQMRELQEKTQKIEYQLEEQKQLHQQKEKEVHQLFDSQQNQFEKLREDQMRELQEKTRKFEHQFEEQKQLHEQKEKEVHQLLDAQQNQFEKLIEDQKQLNNKVQTKLNLERSERKKLESWQARALQEFAQNERELELVKRKYEQIKRELQIYQKPKVTTPTYVSYSSGGRCWGCGHGAGHQWSFNCRGPY